MPRGVYERKPKDASAPKKKRKDGNGYGELLAKMRHEKTLAEDRVVALGTAIEALEALE